MNEERFKIIELHKSEAYLKEIGSTYTSSFYYDTILRNSEGFWRIELVRKGCEKTLEKTYRGRLFEDHVEEPMVFTVVSKERQVGWIELGYDSWNNRMRVWEFLVDDNHRKRGVGTLLMNHAVKIAKERGARMLVLETQTNNDAAIRFYLNFGFELIGLDVAAYSNQDLEKKEVRLELGMRL